MKRHWEVDELIESWTLLPLEMELLGNKTGGNRIGFALLLKFFEIEARFPNHPTEIPETVIPYIAKQVKVSPEKYTDYDWQGRTIKYHRAQIRNFLGFKEADSTDVSQVVDWLCREVVAIEQRSDPLKEIVYQRFRELHLEPPTPGQLERLIRSSLHKQETQFCAEALSKLPPQTLSQIDALLSLEEEANNAIDIEESKRLRQSEFSDLKTDPGPVGLDSFLTEVDKLKRIRKVGLPANLFEKVSPKLLQTYRQRAATESPHELRKHPEPIRYTLISAFCWLRSQEITDNLVELLIQIIHRIGVRAEKRIDKELLNDFRQVGGKTNLLFRLAEAAIESPEGIIKQVLYPVVGEQTLKDLVKEYKSTGLAYRQRVHTVMRSSYASHYRRMVPQILEVLEFRSSNDVHRPVIQALELQKLYQSFKHRRDSLMDLLDALANNLTARSIAELSLNPLFRRNYSALYKAVEQFFSPSSSEKTVEEQQLQQLSLLEVITTVIPEPSQRDFYLFGLDVTPVPRPYAKTLEDRSYIYQPNTIKGNKPINVGHPYSILSLLPEKIDTDGVPWSIPLFRSNRVFYQSPPHQDVTYSRRGHPQWYGERFDLKDETTWHPADTTVQTLLITRQGRSLNLTLHSLESDVDARYNRLSHASSSFYFTANSSE